MLGRAWDVRVGLNRRGRQRNAKNADVPTETEIAQRTNIVRVPHLRESIRNLYPSSRATETKVTICQNSGIDDPRLPRGNIHIDGHLYKSMSRLCGTYESLT
jgi:hypothetical protein